MEMIKIPEERLGILLGEKGRTKKNIEEKAGVNIEINDNGEVIINGDEERVYFSKDIVKAIGRGFSPEIALTLLKNEKILIIINLKEYLNSRNSIRRIKARVIGTEGKVKIEIESATGCNLSIYGHTVGIIGNMDGVDYAREAVEKIINGSELSTIFTYLAKSKRELLQKRLR